MTVKCRKRPRAFGWEAAAEWPLLGMALAFLAAYAWPILNPDLLPSLQRVSLLVTWVAWAAFAVDFAVRLTLATRACLTNHGSQVSSAARESAPA